MARVLVEQSFTQPLTDERYGELAKRLDPCLEVRRGAWRRSSLSKDKLRMICEFEAPDAESVREALRLAKVPYDSVWPADVFAVEDYPEMAARLAALVAQNEGGG
ncbi:MAG: DUF4242 domain-containing protein [Myxococcales bacterium]|nr:DUF4242 domain-containing protein [Myxococcales bacterium]